jgi:tRNA dimethylallyltransferase
MREKIIFIVGPTAIGKTEIAVFLAEKINAEIVSCDSMQVYKHMDIITSKPVRQLRKTVPYHLIDIISPQKTYDVYRYRKDALSKIKAILNKGKVPIFAGGTGLYMSVLIDGIFKANSKNKNIRKNLSKQASQSGSNYLYERLKRRDPQAASRIHPHDAKRIIRALEVYAITGQPISKLQRQRNGLCDKYDIRIFCLNMERDKLYQRIEDRLERMFKQGLIGEVRKLIKLNLSQTANCAIGIKELKGYFDGNYDLKEAGRLIKRNTRAYAKRQLTWFRKDKRIEWMEVGDKEKPKTVAQRIFNKLKNI